MADVIDVDEAEATDISTPVLEAPGLRRRRRAILAGRRRVDRVDRRRRAIRRRATAARCPSKYRLQDSVDNPPRLVTPGS